MSRHRTIAIALSMTALGVATTANADITTGLVQYFNFDETSGTTVFDSSPSGDHGTITINSVGEGAGFNPSSGYIGGSVKLWQSGSTVDYVTVNEDPDDANWDAIGGRTFSLWFNSENITSQRFITGFKNADHKLYVYTEVGGNLRLRVQQNGGDDYNLNTGITVSTDDWHNVIMTFGGGEIPMLFYDGQLVSDPNTTLTPDPIFSSGFQNLGAFDGSGAAVNGMRGSVDEFRMYNRILEGTLDQDGFLTGGDLYELYTFIPEPASASLLMIGAGTLLMRRRGND